MRSLADIRRPDPYPRPLHLARTKEFDRGGRLLRIAERVTEILDATGNASTSAERTGYPYRNGGLRTRWGFNCITESYVLSPQSSLFDAPFEDGEGADAGWEGALGWFDAA